MKTFEISFPNGERKIVEATYYVENTEAGTKVLELYKTVSNYSSESKPYLFITSYESVTEHKQEEENYIYENNIVFNSSWDDKPMGGFSDW